MVLYGLLAYLSWILNLTFLPLAGIGAIMGLAFAYHSLKNPYYVLLLVAVGSYLGNLIYLMEDGAVPVTIFQVFLVLCFLVIVTNRVITSDFDIKILGIELELLLFSALIYLSLIYSPNAENGLFNAIRFSILIAAVYLVVNIVNKLNQVTGILAALVGVALVLGLISVIETILNPSAAALDLVTEGKIQDRASGTQLDPNIFATHFFLPIAFTASLFLSFKSIPYKGTALIFVAIFTLAILSTFSRSAWVSAAVMLVVVAYFHKQMKLFVWLLGGAVLAVIIIPELQYVALNILDRIINIFAGTSDDSSRIRVLLGLAAIYMLFDSYLLGVGFRGFSEAFTDYFTTQTSIGVVEPHNITYTVLAELGIIGFLLFVFIYWKIGLYAYQNIKYSISDFERSVSITLFATFIAFVVFYQFYGGGLFDNNFWILVGLIFAMKLNILKSGEPAKGEAA